MLLSLQVKRPILFMAWDRLFRVPLLGGVMRLFGAFPVDTRPGRGQDAYERAKQLVLDGNLVGIFPEGKRSRDGWMEPELRRGAARLALETGAPLYPATIRGAFRAWPYFRALPEPAKIQVRYHDPIDPAAYRSLPRDEAIEALLAELRARVDRTLLPGVKADRKIEALYRTSAPWPRLFEAVPALGLALFVFWKTRELALVWPCYAYIGYLLLDLLLVPQRRLTQVDPQRIGGGLHRLLRRPSCCRELGLPAPIGRAALAALLLGAGFPYLYDRGRIALGFVQGLVLATLLELGAQYMAATPLGPHLALPLYCAAYAWEERSVFWRYTAPILARLRHRRSAVARRRRRAAAARARGPPGVGARAPAAGRRRRGCGARRGGRRAPELDAGAARLTRPRPRGMMRACPAGARRFATTVAASWVRPSRRH